MAICHAPLVPAVVATIGDRGHESLARDASSCGFSINDGCAHPLAYHYPRSHGASVGRFIERFRACLARP